MVAKMDRFLFSFYSILANEFWFFPFSFKFGAFYFRINCSWRFSCGVSLYSVCDCAMDKFCCWWTQIFLVAVVMRIFVGSKPHRAPSSTMNKINSMIKENVWPDPCCCGGGIKRGSLSARMNFIHTQTTLFLENPRSSAYPRLKLYPTGIRELSKRNFLRC